MNEREGMSELDPRELALLDAYREASEPSPEVEDRLFARLRAAIEIESDSASPGHEHDHQSNEREPQLEAKDGRATSPITLAVVAITAFAAGVALTVGLRGQMAQAVAPEAEGSIAPMVAEDPSPRGESRPASAEACEVVKVPVRVEVPTPVEDETEDAEESSPRDHDPARPRSNRSDEARGIHTGRSDSDDASVGEHVSEDDDSRRPSAEGSGPVAVSPWSAVTPRSGTRPHRRRRRGPDGPSTLPSSPGPSGPAGEAPGSESPGRGPDAPQEPQPPRHPDPTPTPTDDAGPDPTDPNRPEPPSLPEDDPPPDEPEPDEPGPEDEPTTENEDPADCYAHFDQCFMDLQQDCIETEDPDLCSDEVQWSLCEPLLWGCENDPNDPEASPTLDEQCEQEIVECFEWAHTECEPSQDESICAELEYACLTLEAQCYGYPVPPPTGSGDSQDDTDEDADGGIHK